MAPRIGARSARKCTAHSDVNYAVDPMVVLRCTRKLLVRLKRTEVSADVASTTRLGDWYGNILHIGHRQHLLFISKRSRLPVFIPIPEMKPLEAMFLDAVATFSPPSASVPITLSTSDQRCRKSRSAGR
jgi:hypothetical protein